MNNNNLVAVKTKTGTEVHLGLPVSHLAICNCSLPTFKISNDLGKVTCPRCKEKKNEQS